MIELRKHQVDALVKLRDGRILCGGVGSGKSIVAIAYYLIRVCHGKLDPFDYGDVDKHELVIITTARKRDSVEWEGDLAKFGLNKDFHHISIDSWNNIAKYTGRKNAFFIFDEQRLVGSGTWVTSFIKIAKNNRWILLSATPGDVWMDYIPVFVANGFYKNRTEFIRRHVVYSRFAKYPKVDRYIETGRLERLRRDILVDMPFERKTTRHRKEIRVSYDTHIYDEVVKKRFNPYTKEPVKDAGGMCYLLRRISSMSGNRLEKAHILAERHPRLIIFYNFDYELEELRGLGEMLGGRKVAEWNGHKHEPVPEEKEWVYLVNYKAGAEAWNCTTTNAICFYSLSYSYRTLEQSEGRIDRLTTPYSDLYYYYLVSGSGIDASIKRAVDSKKIFNEKAYYDKTFA